MNWPEAFAVVAVVGVAVAVAAWLIALSRMD
jgi:hypothetical protein